MPVKVFFVTHSRIFVLTFPMFSSILIKIQMVEWVARGITGTRTQIMADDPAHMQSIQQDQVNRLQAQIALPGHSGRHAAACLAQLAQLGTSLVPTEALDALLDTLHHSESPLARQRAVRELARLAEGADSVDLSDRIVPALIEMLNPPDGRHVDVRLARQLYLALRAIGTPDALAALDAYDDRLIEAKQAYRLTRSAR